MFIFRLEDNDGRGPWTSGKGSIHQIENHPNYYSDDYPGLYPELQKLHKKFPDNFPIRDFFCATRSLKEFLYWFPENTLAQFRMKTEARISVYKIHKNSVKFGQKQVMFKKDKATFVEKFFPTEYQKILTYEHTK